jgi:hypothetical protein
MIFKKSRNLSKLSPQRLCCFHVKEERLKELKSAECLKKNTVSIKSIAKVRQFFYRNRYDFRTRRNRTQYILFIIMSRCLIYFTPYKIHVHIPNLPDFSFERHIMYLKILRDFRLHTILQFHVFADFCKNSWRIFCIGYVPNIVEMIKNYIYNVKVKKMWSLWSQRGIKLPIYH